VNPLHYVKCVPAIKPAAIVDNATVTADVIDCRGFDFALVVLQLGATDIAMTALKLQQSSTSGGVYADITGATFAAGTGYNGATLALPSATDDGQTCAFMVDMRGREPFLKVVATFGDGSTGGFIAGVAVLGYGKLPPTTSAGVADGDVCLVI
jgi:hypothetical protein